SDADAPMTAAAFARQLRQQATARARRARRELILLVPLLVATILAYEYREDLFGVDTPIRVAAAIVLVIIGWAFARALGRALGPSLFRRMDAGTAGTVGFLIRLVTIAFAVLFALRVAGVQPQTVAVGGALTAVVFGLAAQQTLGNLIAGTVLISARPFRVGDRVRFQAGGLAGQVEGVVTSLGLLYTTLAHGEDSIMVPNSVVLGAAVVPLREPAGVDVRARLRPGIKPSEVHDLIEHNLTVPIRDRPHVGLEEVDGDQVVVRVTATPASNADGGRLADDVLEVLHQVTAEPEQLYPSSG
ncbi:MAG TPA: mechanosensitive ion channel family protein, partial [Thermoleophilaceae bacterium]